MNRPHLYLSFSVSKVASLVAATNKAAKEEHRVIRGKSAEGHLVLTVDPSNRQVRLESGSEPVKVALSNCPDTHPVVYGERVVDILPLEWFEHALTLGYVALRMNLGPGASVSLVQKPTAGVVNIP